MSSISNEAEIAPLSPQNRILCAIGSLFFLAVLGLYVYSVSVKEEFHFSGLAAGFLIFATFSLAFRAMNTDAVRVGAMIGVFLSRALRLLFYTLVIAGLFWLVIALGPLWIIAILLVLILFVLIEK